VFAALITLALLAGQPVEQIAGIRVQGNTLTPDADVIRIAGIEPGAPVAPDTLDVVAARLRASKRFEHVEVVKRYASIADPSRILLVIIVDEGRVRIRPAEDGRPAQAVRRRGPPLMFLPILGSAEGYGFTYGALVSIPNVAGAGTRVSFPLTWGGERRAGIEFEKRADSLRMTRVVVGGAFSRRENTAFDAIDTREQAWVRGERELARPLRVGAWTGFDAVSFAGTDNQVWRTGTDVQLDTRIDPMLSRGAVYVRGALERLSVRDGTAAVRTLLDASGYFAGPGPSTVVLRVYRDGASQPVPPYLKVLLGRDLTLRGYRAATSAGDSTAAGTIELRVPLTSPLSIGKIGVRAFVDAATVYDAGESLRRQHFERGIGGGVWFAATVVRVFVDVAHGAAGSTRVQVTSGVGF
jgi:outer membrane protein assembly factor BamA